MKLAGLAGALIILMASGTASAQNAYLPAGGNGSALGASYFDGDGFDGYGFGVGYHMLGAVGFGVRYDHISRDGEEDVEWDDFKESSLMPTVSVLAFRPDPELPVGLETWFGYSFSEFDGVHIDAVDQEARGSVLNVGMELFARWEPVEKLTLWPRVSGNWYAWSIDGQIAALDVDEDEEISDLELFDMYDLSRYSWSAGVGMQIAEQLVLSFDRVEYEIQDPVYRLSILVLYLNRDEWWK